MKHFKTLLILALLFSLTSLKGYSQTFQAYYQQNYKWNGSIFVSDTNALTSTTFVFNGDQLKIDNSRFTVTNRISNSGGDYATAVSNEDRSIRISIVINVQKDAKGRNFKCLTVERPTRYKIRYYLK